MSEKEVLNHIREYADRCHGHQVRKYTGERYIGHPVRVMEMVRPVHSDVCVLAAALLHDVLEDTPVSPKQMENDLLKLMDTAKVSKTMLIVIDLTDIFDKKNYPMLSRRTRKEKETLRLSTVSPEAQSIKYADIIDNVTDIVKQDADFARTFVGEAKKMLTVMVAGHPGLREKALLVVDSSLKALKKTVDSF